MKIRNEMNVLLKVFFAITLCVSVQVVLFMGDNQMAAQAAGDESESALNASGFDVIILDQEGYKKDRKGPVTFYHQKHAREYELSCWECHHVYGNDKNNYAPWDKTDKCIVCHDPQEEQGNAKKLQPAFHLNCRGCHEKMEIYKDETSLAYKKCNRCHETK